MRRSTILMFLVALATLFLSACAGNIRNTATVKVGMDPQGHVAYADSMYGKISLDDWIDTSVRQEQGTVARALWEKARIASKQGKLEEAKKYIDLAQEVSVNNLYTKAKLINASDYRITVLDGPFAGKVLAPGGSTLEEKVPVGTLSFSVLWGRNQDKRAVIVRPIVQKQKTIVIVNK